MERPLNFNRKL